MSDEDRGTNPYGSLAPVAPQSGEIIQSSRAMQEVQAAIIMAKKDPRDTIRATDNALAECKRVTLAESAIYTYRRGDTDIEGPSIRLAEAIARSWGNIQYAIVEVSRDENESSMLAYAWDLQTNMMARQEFKVPHTRDASQWQDGTKVKIKKPLTDDRDIYESTANSAARRLRACILRLIPGDVVDACVERCKLTLEQAMGKVEEATPKMLAKFAEIGVTQQMIEKRLKKSITAITYQNLVNLGNIFNSIRDGMGAKEDYFEMEPAAESGKPPEGATASAARSAAAKAAGKPQGTTQPPKAAPAPAAKAPDAPKAQEEPPEKVLVRGVEEAESPLNDFRGECYKFISTRVPVADRHFFTTQVDKATTLQELKDIRADLADRYEVF